ncbi:MAG: hypothetical protein M1817_003119 [Caeruleum heppii]|nr:MAG: hypothetical protein M1817_003119 [Caeruleum heppii]
MNGHSPGTTTTQASGLGVPQSHIHPDDDEEWAINGARIPSGRQSRAKLDHPITLTDGALSLPDSQIVSREPSPASPSTLGTAASVPTGGSETSVENNEAEDVRLTKSPQREQLTPRSFALPEEETGRGQDQRESKSSLIDHKPSVSLNGTSEDELVLKLSPKRIHELTNSPQSLALHIAPQPPKAEPPNLKLDTTSEGWVVEGLLRVRTPGGGQRRRAESTTVSPTYTSPGSTDSPVMLAPMQLHSPRAASSSDRPRLSDRTVSTPPIMRHKGSSTKINSSSKPPNLKAGRTPPPALPLDSIKDHPSQEPANAPASPMPSSIPLPPLSTYLQLELSSSRPSPLYIHRSATSDFPYESSKVKFERLLNFLLLPPQLEGVLWFGAMACLDAWLYSFTILPLRFLKALGILGQWCGSVIFKEINDLAIFVWWGSGRMWQRRRHRRGSGSVQLTPMPAGDGLLSRRLSGPSKEISSERGGAKGNVLNGTLSGKTSRSQMQQERKPCKSSFRRHRRTKSSPSALLPGHKADLLKGLVIIFSCLILTRFDASRMYHGIRGQAAIKLYVIYNVLEVCDRLLSALGQDVFECLFSRETLERNANGRSKILRPFGMFLLALGYNVIHSTALFYQVITLNVAVNSYSNALLTLLMSNQFVEIKSTVFKKFEKENLFQLTCADVVERFQLWLMLLIIALRNIVEVGGLTLGSTSTWSEGGPNNLGFDSAATSPGTIIPKSFTIFPKWSGQVLGPFLLVLGSEMIIDFIKHGYVSKFNNIKPAIYGRFLDVLAKDYYSNAFADQNLTRRLGLPVIPLSCLFIRATLQTYHMFLATTVPLPIPSTATSLSESSTTSPATTAALQHLDDLIRQALGRSTFGAGATTFSSATGDWWWIPTLDDLIAFTTMAIFFLGLFLVFLGVKLVLGMLLLGFARRRYRGMKEREKQNFDSSGRRIGGWGVTPVEENKRRWIYLDDPEGEKRARERSLREKAESTGGGSSFQGVSRYSMVAKRIW